MTDEQILDLYFARDEQAVAQTHKKYGGYCFTLANGILRSDQDAEEVVSDTYLNAWNAIPPKRPTSFKLFLARITRNLSFSRWRSQRAGKRGGGEMELVLDEQGQCIAAPGAVDDNLNGRELAKVIQRFLDTLPVREQNLFLRRYFFVEETADIAQRYQMTASSVNRQLSRTRSKLKTYLIQEGYAV